MDITQEDLHSKTGRPYIAKQRSASASRSFEGLDENLVAAISAIHALPGLGTDSAKEKLGRLMLLKETFAMGSPDGVTILVGVSSPQETWCRIPALSQPAPLILPMLLGVTEEC